MSDIESKVPERADRLKKLEELRAMGVDPYPITYPVDTRAAQILADPEKYIAEAKLHALAGRVVSYRSHGKSAFINILDDTGKIQAYVRKDIVGDPAYAAFKLYDIGDFVGIKGPVFKTHTGETTIEAREVALLSKSLLPLPEKFHGLQDVDTRFRKRYLDLIANPGIKELFVKRTKFFKALRDFMDEQGFMEVETPVLERIPGGADAAPFVTRHNTLDIDLYLRISLELHLKRLIIGGYEKVYEIGRVFRNEGMSPQHLQEFTLMECYWAYVDYARLMDFIEEMYCRMLEAVFGTLEIKYQDTALNFKRPWPRHDYRQLLIDKAGIDLDQFPTLETLLPKLREKGIEPDPKLGRGRLIDQLYKRFVRPFLVQPCFLVDHPLDISPLAKRHPGRPDYVQRFQALFAGAEVGNGFSELNDPLDQRARFEEQARLREKGDSEAQMYDAEFVEAMEHGMPPCGGFGLGIDRFFAIVSDSESVRDVVFFPTMRPE
ncbi:MAG: lysine--tRNA ligase [Candidatus Edwardsbacteria bacterium]|nr:lysine--tRNA ligase [Candidatus Edwardsbacteria bacterium]